MRWRKYRRACLEEEGSPVNLSYTQWFQNTNGGAHPPNPSLQLPSILINRISVICRPANLTKSVSSGFNNKIIK